MSYGVFAEIVVDIATLQEKSHEMKPIHSNQNINFCIWKVIINKTFSKNANLHHTYLRSMKQPTLVKEIQVVEMWPQW